MDPRSPLVGMDRTPIQSGGVFKSSGEVKSDSPLALSDPRSPSVNITRTPDREVMRATVGSFARRLGMFFHNETENRVQQKSFNIEEEDAHTAVEVAATEPVMIPQPSHTLSSMKKHATMLATPVLPTPQSVESLSPFVLLENPQVELELETEEAEEARETPLHKRLSMSLITYHEGAASSQIFTDVHNASFSPSECGESKSLMKEEDLSDPIFSVTLQSPVAPSIPANSDDSCITKPTAQPEDAAQSVTSDKTKEVEVKALSAPLSSTPPKIQAAAPSPREAPLRHIRCPTIDSKSPSQVVFKPQWLGKGFGGAGQKVRVKSNAGKGGSSPLALHVAIKNTTNENKGQTGKPTQKDANGRSPLQILNSPREQRSQVKLKVSTPEKPRLAHTDRRVLAVALDKENR